MRQAARRSKSGNASGQRVKEATGGLKRRAGWSGGKHPKNKLYVGDALEDGVQAGEELAQALGVRPLDAGDPVIDLARLRIEQHRQGIQRSHGARGADEQVGEFIHLPGQCSPPAGRDPKKWSARASREAQGGALAHTLQQPAVNALVAIRSARRADVIFATIGPYPFVRRAERERAPELVLLRARRFAGREP